MSAKQRRTELRRRSWSRAGFFAVPLCLSLLTPISSAVSADAIPDSSVLVQGSLDLAPGWQGFYFGVSAGGISWSEPRLKTAPSAEVFGLFGPLTSSELSSLSSTLRSSKGGMFGGQIGFNHLVGRYLLGGEADLSLASTLGRSEFVKTLTTEFCAGTPFHVCVPAPFSYRVKTEHEVPWVATARGRFGYLATERLLVYGTAGLALGSVRAKVDAIVRPAAGLLPEDIVGRYVHNRSSTRIGAALGGGLEYAFSNRISLKAEYLYVNLGSRSASRELERDADDIIPVPGSAPATAAQAGDGIAPPFLPGASVTMRDNSKFHAIRIGINFRF
jgi:outer membrane immunogenic protein